jgi:hypothetical protein
MNLERNILISPEIRSQGSEGIAPMSMIIRMIIALMMEAARTSETLVNFYQTTRCYNPEDSHLHYYFTFNET